MRLRPLRTCRAARVPPWRCVLSASRHKHRNNSLALFLHAALSFLDNAHDGELRYVFLLLLGHDPRQRWQQAAPPALKLTAPHSSAVSCSFPRIA